MQQRLDTGAETEAHAMLPFERRHRLIEQRRRHDAEIVHDGRPARHDLRPPPRRRKALGQHQRVAGQHRSRRRHSQMVHVEQRQRIVEAVTPRFDARQRAMLHITVARREEVGIRQDATFRPPCGAGRVKQRAFGGRGDAVIALRRWTWRTRQHGLRRQAVDHGKIRAAVQPRRSLTQTRHAVRHRHCKCGVRMLEQIAHFLRAIIWIDRHDANAERVERQKMHKELRPVFEQQRDAMTMPIARRAIEVRLPRHGRVNRAITLDVDGGERLIGLRTRHDQKRGIRRASHRPRKDLVHRLSLLHAVCLVPKYNCRKSNATCCAIKGTRARFRTPRPAWPDTRVRQPSRDAQRRRCDAGNGRTAG